MPIELIDLVKKHQPVVVLTGAGISTLSGIPAYRDSNGSWIQSKPVQARDFRSKESTRRRYWQRSMAGWPGFHNAMPNEAHLILAELQRSGLVSAVITQNVDGLHQRAGSKHVIDLHGTLAEVICLQCNEQSDREALQIRLRKLNPDFTFSDFRVLADGDASITSTTEATANFDLVNCRNCGGTLKPNVVFFGENVPVQRVKYCMNELDKAGMLLCIGTSLAVFSGYRFCRAAHEAGKPIAIINKGITRADEIATLKISADCAETLKLLRDNY